MSDERAGRQVPESIVCVECGGQAHLLTTVPPEEALLDGDVVAYRCADCMDRFDVMVGEPDA